MSSRDDIPQPRQEGNAERKPNPTDNTFLTVHFFPHSQGLSTACWAWARQNSDVWQPLEKDHWPTPTIFNFVYGRAVLKHWGLRLSLDLEAKVQEKYGEIAKCEEEGAKERKERRLRDRLDRLEKLKEMGDSAMASDDDDDDSVLSPPEYIQLLIAKGRMERGDTTPLRNDMNQELEGKIDAWRHRVTND